MTDATPSEFKLHIRPYRSNDREFVLGLAPRLVLGIQAWRDPKKMEMTMRGYIMESIQSAEEGEEEGLEAAVFVAEDQDEVRLGFATVERNLHFTGEVQAYLGELAVREEAEGRGIGSALVGACEAWAREHGFTLLVLDTGGSNKRARELYQHLGFIEESVKLTKPL
ncbi:MAG: hypothetical protein NVS2B12_39520 [Ktedonobacteraceae bacterium]